MTAPRQRRARGLANRDENPQRQLAAIVSHIDDDGNVTRLTMDDMILLMSQQRDDAATMVRERRAAVALMAQAMDDERARRAFLQLEREADLGIKRMWARFKMQMRAPKKPERERRQQKKRTTHQSRRSRPPKLPHYSRDIIDPMGRVGIYYRARYVSGRKGASYLGCAKAVWRYLIRDGAYEHDANGIPGLLSNMGDDIAEVAAACDLLESVQRASRANAKLFTIIEVSLPHDVSPEARLVILHNFCEKAFGQYDLPYGAVVHHPSEDGDQRNPHGHIIVFWRPTIRVGSYEWQVARDLATEHDSTEMTNAHREIFADTMSWVAQAEGHKRIYTGLSHAARGLALKPTRKIGKELVAAHRRGERVPLIERNADIIRRNEALLAAIDLELVIVDTARRREALRALGRQRARAVAAAAAGADVRHHRAAMMYGQPAAAPTMRRTTVPTPPVGGWIYAHEARTMPISRVTQPDHQAEGMRAVVPATTPITPPLLASASRPVVGVTAVTTGVFGRARRIAVTSVASAAKPTLAVVPGRADRVVATALPVPFAETMPPPVSHSTIAGSPSISATLRIGKPANPSHAAKRTRTTTAGSPALPAHYAARPLSGGQLQPRVKATTVERMAGGPFGSSARTAAPSMTGDELPVVTSSAGTAVGVSRLMNTEIPRGCPVRSAAPAAVASIAVVPVPLILTRIGLATEARATVITLIRQRLARARRVMTPFLLLDARRASSTPQTSTAKVAGLPARPIGRSLESASLPPPARLFAPGIAKTPKAATRAKLVVTAPISPKVALPIDDLFNDLRRAIDQRRRKDKAARAIQAKEAAVEAACRIVLEARAKPYERTAIALLTDWSHLTAADRAIVQSVAPGDERLRRAVATRADIDCRIEQMVTALHGTNRQADRVDGRIRIELTALRRFGLDTAVMARAGSRAILGASIDRMANLHAPAALNDTTVSSPKEPQSSSAPSDGYPALTTWRIAERDKAPLAERRRLAGLAMAQKAVRDLVTASNSTEFERLKQNAKDHRAWLAAQAAGGHRPGLG